MVLSPLKLRSGKLRNDLCSTPILKDENEYFSDDKLDLSEQYPSLKRDWLTDNDINLFFNHLNLSFKLKCKKIFLVDPLISSIIRLDYESSKRHLESIKIKKFDFVLFPVNNCSPQFEGSHWSLLVYNKGKNKYYHFDSITSLNHNVAQNLADNFSQYLHHKNKPEIVQVNCQQQNNSYDCGVYLLYFSQEIITNLVIYNVFETEFEGPVPVAKIRKFLEDNEHSKKTYDVSRSSHEVTFDKSISVSDKTSKKEILLPDEVVSYKHKSPRVLLLGDSHMKNLALSVSSRFNCDSKIRILGITKPNATLGNVISDLHNLTLNYTKQDSLYLLAGTNDVEKYGGKQFDFQFTPLIECSKKTNLNLILIPYRFDRNYLNQAIYKVNKKLYEFAIANQINVIDTSIFPRSYFTNHGLHLNKYGKSSLTSIIYDDISLLIKPRNISVITNVQGFQTRFKRKIKRHVIV